jgi:hypothetical protein
LAAQIEKKFECPYDRCYKYYGSDVSLNLHIKLKHNGGNKTDREKLAEEICAALINGVPPPTRRFNLPPNYVTVPSAPLRTTNARTTSTNASKREKRKPRRANRSHSDSDGGAEVMNIWTLAYLSLGVSFKRYGATLFELCVD